MSEFQFTSKDIAENIAGALDGEDLVAVRDDADGFLAEHPEIAYAEVGCCKAYNYPHRISLTLGNDQRFTLIVRCDDA